jgi:hypothetical protein
MRQGNSRVDPITREIIQTALAAAADEMALGLYRTAYSRLCAIAWTTPRRCATPAAK